MVCQDCQLLSVRRDAPRSIWEIGWSAVVFVGRFVERPYCEDVTGSEVFANPGQGVGALCGASGEQIGSQLFAWTLRGASQCCLLNKKADMAA